MTAIVMERAIVDIIVMQEFGSNNGVAGYIYVAGVPYLRPIGTQRRVISGFGSGLIFQPDHS